MRHVNALGVTGLVLLLAGATTFLTDDSFLPLWITWIVGPLFWYLGFAVSLVWGYHYFFAQTSETAKPRYQNNGPTIQVTQSGRNESSVRKVVAPASSSTNPVTPSAFTCRIGNSFAIGR